MQIIVGSPDVPISHMVQLLVLPSNVECMSFESCEIHKLQVNTHSLTLSLSLSLSHTQD